MKPKALLVTTDFPPSLGGLQSFSLALCEILSQDFELSLLAGQKAQIKKKGLLGFSFFKVFTQCITGFYQATPNSIDLKNLQSRYFFPASGRFAAFFWTILKIPHLYFRYQFPYCLHIQWNTAIPSLLIKKLLPSKNLRVIIFAHGAELADPGRLKLNRIKSWVFRNCDLCITGSQASLNWFHTLDLSSPQEKVIHYPVKIPSTQFGTEKKPLQAAACPKLLMLHRLVPRKGTLFALDAFTHLLHLEWSLTIVGEGPEEKSVDEWLLKYASQRAQRIPTLSQSDKEQIMAESDLFILPSLEPKSNNHMEGLGLTLCEAQLQGTPVLAARTGGIPEAMCEAVSGLLFNPGNREDFCRILSQLLENPPALFEMGKAARVWIQGRFDYKSRRELYYEAIMGKSNIA